MEILGVGPLEFILFLVLALVILGPQDMVGTARKIGQWVYRVVRSPTWRAILETSQDLRDLPQKIVRDAGLEETMKEIKDTATEVKSDINQTTRELTAEMQAATSEVSREMQTVVQDANAGMKEASTEAQAAMQSAAAGLSGSENTILPPTAQIEPVALEEAAPAAVEEPLPDPYKIQLDTIAAGLGGKALQESMPEEAAVLRAAPEESTESAIPSAPAAEIQAEPPPRPTYVAGLETFAQALGAPTSSPQEAEKSTLERQAPAATEPAPPPWAIGIPAGLNLPSADGVEERLRNQMDAMTKALEKLDAKIQSPTGAVETPAPSQGEPGTFTVPPGNGDEPAAAPARIRRNAKRPLEAQAVPAPEAAEDQTPKAAPRKRAEKTTTPAAEGAAGVIPAAAPRKRAAKSTSPAAEAVEGEATRAAPRARTPKKTPASEPAE